MVRDINRFLDQGVDYATPGRYLVEFFTWMKYLPSFMAKWKREAEGAFKEFSTLFAGMYHEVEKQIVMPLLRCCPPPTTHSFLKQEQGDECSVGTLIRDRQRHGLSDTESAWLAAAMIVRRVF